MPRSNSVRILCAICIHKKQKSRMSRIILVILFAISLLLVDVIVTNAQWAIQSALPTGRSLNSAYFISPSHGFVTGNNHYLLETMDGGTTWSVRMYDSTGTDPFYRIAFGSSQIGFISGNNGVITD